MIPVASQYRFTSLDDDIEFIIVAALPGPDCLEITKDPARPDTIRKRVAEALKILDDIGVIVSHHRFRYISPTTNECVFVMKGI